jgi:hypothetical protein
MADADMTRGGSGVDTPDEVKATIRGLGQYDVSGAERFEIHLSRAASARLMHRVGIPTALVLEVGKDRYRAELRSTEKNTYAWVSAKVFDHEGRRTTLVNVLISNGFRKNQGVILQMCGGVVRVVPQ